MKRFCICVFYEKDGIVRDNITYYLKGLQEVAEKILLVVNGKLTEEGKSKVYDLGIDIFQRENNGLDFGGWKEALEKIGYEELSNYDELILTNTTCYGPIYPLSEMFNEMEQRDNDFWGITKHPEVKEYLIKGDNKSQILEHIQTYFIVFNKRVFLSTPFKGFLDNVKLHNDYKKVVAYYECKLTNFLELSGFKSDSYIELDSYKKYVFNPKYCTDILLEQHKLPLIRKDAIIEPYKIKFEKTLPYRSSKIINYVKKHSDYDTNMIYDDIISSYPMSQIKANFHLNYVLPSNYNCSNINKDFKIALILYIYYEDLVEFCYNYAKSMPQGADIYIISSKTSTLEECKNKAYILKDYNLIYRLKENKGRDVSAYLITCADVFKNYDLICCVHDKKSPHALGIRGADFQYEGFECNLKSSEYVNNVINLFESNNRLGLLCPPAPNYAGFKALNDPIGVNAMGLKRLYDFLNLSVPFDNNPVAPFGAMFWVRGDALSPLFRHEWIYSDFPEEPLPPDGTISHVIERIYPYVVQEAGYLSGWIMPDDFGSIYIDNLLIDNIVLKNPCYQDMKNNSFIEQIFSIKNTFDKKYKVITILGIKFKFKIKVKNRYIKFSSSECVMFLLRKLSQFIFRNTIKKNSKVKILVCLHLFYPNSWKTISQYLKNLETYNYELIITCTEGHYNKEILNEILKFKPDSKISIYPNFGFDVGPFIDELQGIDLSEYDIVYKLHSKGVNRSFIYIYNQIFKYEDWFYNLYNAILGPFTVHKTIDKIYNSPDIGIVAAKNLIISDPKHKQFFTNEFANKYNIKINKKYHYVAGTCFAIKAKLLKPIEDLNMKIGDFSKTKRGEFSLAHAMERLVCACIEPQGFKFYGINVPHKKYCFEKQLYEKYSPIRLLNDTSFNLDYDFFYKVLEMLPIKKYEIVNLKLKDIKRFYKGKILDLKDCHPYKYLQGEISQYKEYCSSNKTETMFDMSELRFKTLIDSINLKSYDSKNVVVVDSQNILLDGQHRCCILLNKYGEDYVIPVLKVHFNEISKLSSIENIFSITNTRDKTHKVITILGIKFKFKRKVRSK